MADPFISALRARALWHKKKLLKEIPMLTWQTAESMAADRIKGYVHRVFNDEREVERQEALDKMAEKIAKETAIVKELRKKIKSRTDFIVHVDESVESYQKDRRTTELELKQLRAMLEAAIAVTG